MSTDEVTKSAVKDASGGNLINVCSLVGFACLDLVILFSLPGLLNRTAIIELLLPYLEWGCLGRRYGKSELMDY